MDSLPIGGERGNRATAGKKFDLGAISSIKKAHCWAIVQADPNRVMMRQYSCYCEDCAVGKWRKCRREWTDIEGWNDNNQRLKFQALDIAPASTDQIRGVFEGTRGGVLHKAREAVGKRMERADYFVVPSDPEHGDHDPEHPFWLVQALGQPYELESRMARDVEGLKGRKKEFFCQGDWVVSVRYWEREKGGNGRKFFLNTAHVAKETVNCYLCVCNPLSLPAQRLDGTTWVLKMTKDVDEDLTRMVRNLWAPPEMDRHAVLED